MRLYAAILNLEPHFSSEFAVSIESTDRHASFPRTAAPEAVNHHA
jgi:hypothetical protein